MIVSLFIPCYIDQLFPRVGISVVRVLERLGHTVEVPQPQSEYFWDLVVWKP